MLLIPNSVPLTCALKSPISKGKPYLSVICEYFFDEGIPNLFLSPIINRPVFKYYLVQYLFLTLLNRCKSIIFSVCAKEFEYKTLILIFCYHFD